MFQPGFGREAVSSENEKIPQRLLERWGEGECIKVGQGPAEMG